jgi:hypothetical protein
VFPAGGRLRHELYIDSGDASRNIQIFLALRQQQAAIEQAYGRPLEWEELPSRQACRVGDYTEGDVTQTERHPNTSSGFWMPGNGSAALWPSPASHRPLMPAKQPLPVRRSRSDRVRLGGRSDGLSCRR